LDEGSGGTIGDVLFTKGFAFVRGDRNVYVVDDSGDPNSPQRLTTAGGAYQPSVSRDGRSIVFVQKTGSTTSLQTVPTTGGVTATLFGAGDAACGTRGCANFRFPTFSPDGRSVVFVFDRGSGTNGELGQVNVDGSGFKALTPNAGLAFGAPSFFPNGTTVLALAGNSSANFNQLARVPLNGGSITYNNSLGNEVLSVVNRAVVSPDGSQVALDARLSSGSTRIFVGPLTSTGIGALRRVTDYTASTVQETFPSWTGSSQLGFLFADAGGDPSIYRATVSASPGSVTLAVPTATEPSYGPI
jgi:TolB protein